MNDRPALSKIIAPLGISFQQVTQLRELFFVAPIQDGGFGSPTRKTLYGDDDIERLAFAAPLLTMGVPARNIAWLWGHAAGDPDGWVVRVRDYTVRIGRVEITHDTTQPPAPRARADQ